MFKVNVDRVRSLMFERGLSLKDFAAQSGLNALTVAKIVRDDSATASAQTIATVAKFFGVNGNELVAKS